MTRKEKHVRRLMIWSVALVTMLAAAFPAQAAFQSAYTDIDLNECLILHSDDFGSSWACPGYRGYPMRVAEGELRFTIGYGFNIDAEPFGGAQPLGPANRLGPEMEWRLSNATGRWVPIATIVRYLTQSPDAPDQMREVLVVTQLVEGATCHIAYADATADENAEELARAAADSTAGSFDCAEEPERLGNFAAW